MTTAADQIKAFLASVLQGFELHYPRWRDDVADKTRHYAVLRPAGGGRAELLRTPQFTLTLIGPENSDALALQQAADLAINAMRTAGSQGDLVSLQPAEPVYTPTDDGRPVLEIAISAITH